MKKITSILTGIALSISFTINAQNATESTIEILKVLQPCATATYNQNSDVMEDALKQKMQNAKLGSGDKSKGFRIYKAVIMPEISANKIDFYTKVDGKKETSTVTIAVSNGYDNFINGKTDPEVMEKMKAYLNSLNSDGNKLRLKLDTQIQEEAVAKATKNVNNSVDDGKDLLKDKEKLDKKIENNKKEQEELSKKLEEEKTKLNTLIEKAKTL